MNHPSNWIIFYFLSWVKQTKLFMCWELDPNILAIWAFAITWPQLGHNFAKRLNFLPPAPLSVCAALQDTATGWDTGTTAGYIWYKGRSLSPTVSWKMVQHFSRSAFQLPGTEFGNGLPKELLSSPSKLGLTVSLKGPQRLMMAQPCPPDLSAQCLAGESWL